jgi:hypothetical protein
LAHLGNDDFRVAAIRKAIDATAPMRDAAYTAKPDGQHGGVKIGYRAALDQGSTFGWEYPHVAAALLLTGVDRSKLGSLSERLRKRQERSLRT